MLCFFWGEPLVFLPAQAFAVLENVLISFPLPCREGKADVGQVLPDKEGGKNLKLCFDSKKFFI